MAEKLSAASSLKQTASGIPVETYYGPESLPDFSAVGVPGRPPYTRGIHETMYRTKPWTIRHLSGFSTPEETNLRAHYEVAHGSTGLSFAVDMPTTNGMDSDDPEAKHDVGVCGVSISSLEDMELLLAGLQIDRLSTYVPAAGFDFCPLLAMYFVAAEKRGIPFSALRGTSQAELLLFTVCSSLKKGVKPEHVFRLMVDGIEWCVEHVENWYPVNFDAYNYRESGLSAFAELGLLMYHVEETTKELLKRGNLPVNRFASRYTYNMSIHNDFFEEIAKFRAARRMLYKLLHDDFGVTEERALKFRFHAQSNGTTHTYQEPLNNAVRIAYQVLAGALGGAQSIHANSYDEAICLPTEQSRLLSIRTQQIAQEESNIINVVDPLGGSYYVEWLTNEVEQRALSYLNQKRAKGGLVRIVESGELQKELVEATIERERRITVGETRVVGVNCYTSEQPSATPVPTFRINPQTTEIQCRRLAQLRARRDNARVEAALNRLQADSLSGANVMDAVMEAVRSYATIGEICDVWRNLWGTWQSTF